MTPSGRRVTPGVTGGWRAGKRCSFGTACALQASSGMQASIRLDTIPAGPTAIRAARSSWADVLFDGLRASLAGSRADALLGMQRFVEILARARAQRDATSWRSLVSSLREHRLRALCAEDPYTDRASRKPRGYPGDAVLLDFVYQHSDVAPLVAAATPLGREIHAYTARASSGARAVRARRDRIAARIDRVAQRTENARILSFGCGHLREAEQSMAVARGALAALVAADADAETAARVAEQWEGTAVRPVCRSLGQLIRGRASIAGSFDLVYALGLHDYLGARAGRALVARLFDLTAPGGTVVIANFLPSFDGAAYMEAMMDCWLVYRDEAELLALARDVPEAELADVQIDTEPTGSIAFLEITKKR